MPQAVFALLGNMSTFSGTLVEYERLSIDRFDGHNVNSTAFFLSHCHRDHMQGIDGGAFRKRLRSRGDLKLYASAVSCRLLLNELKYAWLRRRLTALPLDAPTTLTVPADGAGSYTVVVTAIPANHCAGSVMFLLEGERGTVLYTGDFRLDVGSASNLGSLHCDAGRLKPIDAAYVDTTLCRPDAAYVPTRQDSERALVDFFEPKFRVGGALRLALPGAKLGYETLFTSLALAFGMKVHVSRGQMSRYAGIVDVVESLTLDAETTRIHADCKCDVGPNCVTVKPSAMWFAQRVAPSRLIERVADGVHRLCYSTHASLAEVRDFVRYLQPRTVRANVCLRGVDVATLLGVASSSRAQEPAWNFWGPDDDEPSGTTDVADKLPSRTTTVLSRWPRTAVRPAPYPVSSMIDALL
ncbi:DNA cross-link repair protein snm1 [Dermacentor variabilis]|uniref:DNA cross-link repair protein snm1 n=1 Tax=Dermacentor variabilis TaxID=34621 RepID=UPI003F5B5425